MRNLPRRTEFGGRLTTILVPTIVQDLETLCVSLALQRKGHTTIRWFMEDYPSRQTSSVAVSDASWAVRLRDHELDIQNLNFDTMWFRRPTAPYLGEFGDLSAQESQIANRELLSYRNGLWEALSGVGRWVNPYHAVRKAASKTNQLQLASKLGLAIPDTLISNDPGEIRAFMKACGGTVVYKAFSAIRWNTSTGCSTLYTSLIGPDDLPSDHKLQAVPGIYQREVEKDFEVRAVFIGSKVFAVKLFSQESEQGKVDWRAERAELRGESHVLPENIELACRQLMLDLGLVCGSFDFAVDKQGRYVFFEVNESGQCIWLETIAPELNVLDALSCFLAGEESTSAPIRMQEIHTSREFQEQVQKDLATRLAPRVTPFPSSYTFASESDKADRYTAVTSPRG